jgi:hypothetical protein
MKLKTFDLSNTKTIVTKEPVIRISKSAGLISLNASAAAAIGLAAGDRIVFVQDEDSPRDWYIKKSTDDNAFPVRDDEGRKDLNSSHIAHRIINSAQKASDKEWQAAGFKLQANPVEMDGENYYLIITANPMNISYKEKQPKN